MLNWSRGVIGGMGVGIVLLMVFTVASVVNSQPPEQKGAAAKTTVPTGQTYIGAKRCASCHFKQFASWKKTKHAKQEAWTKMPAQYHTNPECLACHTTGYGEATGFKDEASSPNLISTTCEACHGPGSKHEEIAKTFSDRKPTPEEEQKARDAIYRVQPRNVCVACHAVLGHKEHPKYEGQQ